jgi:hypothetical protein
MVLLWQLLLQFVKDLFRSRAALQVENLLLRQQVNLLKRKHPTTSSDKSVGSLDLG